MDANAPMSQEQAGVQHGPLADEIQLENFFTYHPPTNDDVIRYETINVAALHLARTIHRMCPAGSDRTAAVRLVREARMTANAAIACKGANYR